LSTEADTDARDAADGFAKVFEAFEPWGRSFADGVPRRLLIYETDPFGLGVSELAALREAADEEDLARVFVVADRPTGRPDDPNLFVLAPLDEATYKSSLEPWTITPHAIFPRSGRWGVMTTNDGYVVAGGSQPFIAALLGALGRDEDGMIAAWLDGLADIQGGTADGGRKIAAWAPAQLRHVVGPERAARALAASRLIQRF
jgi:hypothetical protein